MYCQWFKYQLIICFLILSMCSIHSIEKVPPISIDVFDDYIPVPGESGEVARIDPNENDNDKEKDRIEIRVGDSVLTEQTITHYKSTFIDVKPFVDNIVQWTWKITLYHEEGEICVKAYKDKGTKDKGVYHSYMDFEVPVLSSKYDWIRNPDGYVRAVIIVTAIDKKGKRYIGGKEIGISTKPRNAALSDSMKVINVLTLNLDNDGSQYYLIYYDTDTGEPYNGKGALEGDSPVRFNAWDDIELTGLKTNTTWHIAIKGFNDLGEGPLSKDYSVYVKEPSATINQADR